MLNKYYSALNNRTLLKKRSKISPKQNADFPKTGFTLIEMLISIALVLIIGTFTVIFFSRFLGQTALSDAQDKLLGKIRKAQYYAMGGRQGGSWGLHYGSHTVTLFQGNSYATRNAGFDESFTVNSSISISGLPDVVFAKVTGIPDTGALTITLSSTIGSKTITVNQYGISTR